MLQSPKMLVFRYIPQLPELDAHGYVRDADFVFLDVSPSLRVQCFNGWSLSILEGHGEIIRHRPSYGISVGIGAVLDVAIDNGVLQRKIWNDAADRLRDVLLLLIAGEILPIANDNAMIRPTMEMPYDIPVVEFILSDRKSVV